MVVFTPSVGISKQYKSAPTPADGGTFTSTLLLKTFPGLQTDNPLPPCGSCLPPLPPSAVFLPFAHSAPTHQPAVCLVCSLEGPWNSLCPPLGKLLPHVFAYLPLVVRPQLKCHLPRGRTLSHHCHTVLFYFLRRTHCPAEILVGCLGYRLHSARTEASLSGGTLTLSFPQCPVQCLVHPRLHGMNE